MYFLIGILFLFVGYFTYGKLVEKIFGADNNNPTPSTRQSDGVDYIPLGWKRIFLIQFLNIAGLGPIFGAVAGALWGPVAFIWIAVGCVFGGAVHDYLAGMISVRQHGASLSELHGKYLGSGIRHIMGYFTVFFLIIVGVVFVKGPAALMSKQWGGNEWYYVAAILLYYIIATLLPINKVIGKIYPVFGLTLLFMGVGILGCLIFGGYDFLDFTTDNLHPQNTPIMPTLFITIACGAVSGFHATQSPMMARCLKKEKDGRRVFFGAMIAEGVIAMIWAAAAMSFFGGIEGLLDAGAAPIVVERISTGMLGTIGGLLALLGVIVCPISTGDTAFRSARLTIADHFKFPQKPIKNRLMIAIPMFAVATFLVSTDFSVLWRYFSWENQILAMVTLWALSVYLKQKRNFYLITLIPALFMTTVTVMFLFVSPLELSYSTSGYLTALVVAFFVLLFFMRTRK